MSQLADCIEDLSLVRRELKRKSISAWKSMVETGAKKVSFVRNRATQWSSWLRHCLPSLNVAVSIPDWVVETFHLHNISCLTMSVGSPQVLTWMRTNTIYWGSAVCKLSTLLSSCVECPAILGASTSWSPQGCKFRWERISTFVPPNSIY